MLAIAAPAASAQPWQCDASGYVTQYDLVRTSGNTLFQRVVRQPDGFYALVTLGQFDSTHVNALGFRAQDGFIYAVDNTNETVLRIEDDGTGRPVATDIGGSADLPRGRNVVTGAVLHDGSYAVWDPGRGIGVLYDVSGATARKIVDLRADDANFPDVWDWAVNPGDGRLYASEAAGNGVYEIGVDPATGRVWVIRQVASRGSPGGAQWFLPNQTLMLYDNSGGMWAVNPLTGTRVQLGDAPQASNVDATSCAYGLDLTKDVNPRVVNAGDELVYTYTIVNRALSTSTITFSDVLPPGMTYVDGGVTIAPPTFTPNAYGGTDTLTFSGSPAPGQDITITARVRVAPEHACGVEVENTAQVTLEVPGLPPVTVSSDDPTTDDPGDPTVARVDCAADLAITKEALSTPALPGQQLAYRLVVRNNGPSLARNVVVTDSVPAELTVESVPGYCTVAGAEVRCALGTLAPSATQTIEIVTRVADSAVSDIVNTAQVASDTPDPNLANNRDDERVPVEPIADLAIVKQAQQARVVPGKQLTYELRVTNLGPSTARNVVVSDTLPRGLSVVSTSDECTASGAAIRCSLAELAAGRSVTFKVVVRVANSHTGNVVNTATVTSDTRDPNLDNNTDREQLPPDPEADLSITKVPSVASVRVGQQLFYTLTIRNDGPSDAVDVVVSDVAGAALTPQSARASQGSCSIAGKVTTCRLGTLPAGGTAQVLVSARADAAGTLINDASVDSATQDPDPSNNRTRAEVPSEQGPVPPAADLEIVKVARPRAVTGSKSIRFTLRVTNHGPVTATGVKVVDTPRLPLTVVSTRPSQGSCERGLPIRCQLGTLQPGQTATIEVVAKPRAAGTLRNAASVTGDQPDPNPANNISRASVRVRGKLAVSKVANRRVVAAGSRVSYRIRVTNKSGFALRDVRVCDRLPAGLTYVSAKPTGRISGGQRCWTIARLGAGKTATIRLIARALPGASGVKVNRVTAKAPDTNTARARRAVRIVGGDVRAGGITG